MRSPPAKGADGLGGNPPYRRRSHLLPLLGGGAGIIAVIVILTGWAILQGKDDAHRTAEAVTANLSQTLAENFGSTIHLIDLGLLAIQGEIDRQQKGGQWDDGAIAAAVAQQDAWRPDLTGFRVFGPDGTLRYGTTNVVNRDANYAQHDEFKFLRDTPGSGLVVTPPVFGGASQQWLVGLARRITNPDGSFGGAVYGSIPSRLLTADFSALDLGSDGVILLCHSNFRIAAWFPVAKGMADPTGTDGISAELRALIGSGAEDAHYDAVSPVDGVRRVVHVRRIAGLPYFILVALSERDYLADWRRNSVHLLLFGGLMVAGVLAGMVILHRRISDWRQANADLAEKTELLIQSNADLEQFAYVASHDLQTPLRNIISYTQLLERRYKDRLDADADDFIGFIVDSSKRMTQLINDLLDYSRTTSQERPLGPTPAAGAVDRALVDLKADLDRSGASVAVGDLPLVMAEPSHLVSVFQNLLGNALKYRAADRPLRISVTAERGGLDQWRFAVADNGIGIEPQYFDKIFEIFQRLHPAVDAAGTGIGLALCRRIVHRFGGTIWVDSTPGAGTTFFFTLRDGSAG
jgi:signal transduction histidine kinase